MCRCHPGSGKYLNVIVDDVLVLELWNEKFSVWHHPCFRSQPILTQWGEFKCALEEHSGDTWLKFMQCTGGLIPGGCWWYKIRSGGFIVLWELECMGLIFLFLLLGNTNSKGAQIAKRIQKRLISLFSSWCPCFCYPNLNLVPKYQSSPTSWKL